MTYSLHSRVDIGEVNRLYLYINGVALPESYHWTRSSSRKTGSTGGRELTLQVKAGDTMSLRATTIDDSLLKIYFCVAFEHGTDQQSSFSARDEDIPTLEYQDGIPAGYEDISSPEYQDQFSAGDEKYFSPDLKKSHSTKEPPNISLDLSDILQSLIMWVQATQAGTEIVHPTSFLEPVQRAGGRVS